MFIALKALALAVLFSVAGSCFAFETSIPPVNAARENLRRQSATQISHPQIEMIETESGGVWKKGETPALRLNAGERIRIYGSGFGAGPDIDYSKIMFGKVRALERDLLMYKGNLNLIKRLFSEKPNVFSKWPTNIKSWSDTFIEVTVPVIAAGDGPLVIQVQKRTGANASLDDPSTPFTLWDPLTERIEASFAHPSDVVSVLGAPAQSNSVPLQVRNPDFEKQVKLGEAIFWSYDYNIGLVHKMVELDWDAIFSGRAKDPVTGAVADPVKLFGAFKIREGEVPKVASQPFYFDPYPMPMPLKPLLRPSLKSGWVSPSGHVGHPRAESIHPITNTKGAWIGISCAACHTQRLTYETAPGKTVTRVVPGIPNYYWSMKWTTLSNLHGVKEKEKGPDGKTELVDKTMLLYSIPPGLGENTIVRLASDGSIYANDYLFSPTAIPDITRHTPLRRALARTEMIAGFEGSYIHSEEPDGAMGAMRAEELAAFTAYMSSLDSDETMLRNLGIYRWLKKNGALDEVNLVSEGEFMTTGYAAYPRFASRIENGKRAFQRNCQSCHAQNFDTWTDENMIRLTEVGTYFSPSLFHRQTQSIRTSVLRNLYWAEPRGFMHDGHIKNLRDTVDPDRCREGSTLYNRYYTMNEHTFRVPKGTAAQERFTRRHAYFVDAPFDQKNLYWDYQAMRKNFGPRELGLKQPVALPAMPHPWCADNASDVEDLVRYLLTL